VYGDEGSPIAAVLHGAVGLGGFRDYGPSAKMDLRAVMFD